MGKYAEAEEKRQKRNDIHVRMIEQAGEDRVLFMNAKPQEYVDMRFPEYVSAPERPQLAQWQIPELRRSERTKNTANAT